MCVPSCLKNSLERSNGVTAPFPDRTAALITTDLPPNWTAIKTLTLDSRHLLLPNFKTFFSPKYLTFFPTCFNSASIPLKISFPTSVLLHAVSGTAWVDKLQTLDLSAMYTSAPSESAKCPSTTLENTSTLEVPPPVQNCLSWKS